MQPLLGLPFLAFAFAQQSGVHLTVLPSESPTVTQADNWRCATKDIVGYFEPPYPTGALYSARLSYGDEIQPCTYTGGALCPFPEKSLWCGFSTAIPSTLLDQYESYGSTAASWWGARSSAAVSIAEECPQSWWLARDRVSFGATKLNLTIIEAECYAEAHATSSGPVQTSTLTSSTSGISGPLQTSTLSSSASGSSGSTPTQTPDVDSAGVKRAENAAFWSAAGTCIAAGAIILVL
ncbi:uncharacterized protein RCC_04613 [Ramularia collo-cygni]|uniref:DUF7735 domain-containing protein n=1 Tax=Ramularia collo-cygni TaxID=112498 RepID=A0A2D3VB28_9PEZI|nr:uncharacterized protein RCC_04613 [Ramularia collo-cygni]CZT18769.1 uncharacterized protein RCC_04613 [Ramularia collo-cygni]